MGEALLPFRLSYSIIIIIVIDRSIAVTHNQLTNYQNEKKKTTRTSMKLALFALAASALVGSALGLSDEELFCQGAATQQNACEDNAGCTWEGSGQDAHCDYVDHTHTDCAARVAGNGAPSQEDCERNDEKCIYAKVGGTRTCEEANRGSGVTGASCQSKLVEDDTDYYLEIESHGCAEGYTCEVTNSIPFGDYGSAINGTCQSSACVGKKVPGNCNGNTEAAGKEQCDAETERVTICHRTCSRKNPWVRITIDEDAWSGEGCGHALQHDIRDECSNKAPWSEWGENFKDYLIINHGTRANVSLSRNTAQVKAYWRKWEPACPYVRNGHCCNWEITNPDDADYSPCCGEDFGPDIAEPTPEVSIVKWVVPAGECVDAEGMSLMTQNAVDDLYTLQDLSEQWQYCYAVSVPNVTTGECLYNVLMTDPAPSGLTSQVVTDPLPNGNKPGDSEVGNTLCPGETKYFGGPTITGLPHGPELDIYAEVTGTGIDSGHDVTDTDDAGVTFGFTPALTVIKYAGPPVDDCPDADKMTDTEPDFNTNIYHSGDKTFKYCYEVTVHGNECLYDAQMVDIATGGIGTYDLAALGTDGKICPGEKFLIGGPASTTNDDLPQVSVTVSGTGEHSTTDVSSSDDAGVDVADLIPEVTLKKFAGPAENCPAFDDMGTANFVDDIYETGPAPHLAFKYCYYIENVGNECLVNATMTDPAVVGEVWDLGPLFCPTDDPIVIHGNTSYTETGEDSLNAKVTGAGQYSGATAMSEDPAGVSVRTLPPSPSPSECPAGPMTDGGASYCPGYMVLENIIGAPEMSLDMIYAISSTDGGESVSFKVDNPFPTDLTMYVKYHAPSIAGGGGWRQDCHNVATGACAVDTEVLTADCLEADGLPYTMIQIYLADDNVEAPIFTGGAEVDKCCPAKPDPVNSAVVAQYTFIMACTCPTSSGRRLRQVDSKMDTEKIVAMFEKRN